MIICLPFALFSNSYAQQMQINTEMGYGGGALNYMKNTFHYAKPEFRDLRLNTTFAYLPGKGIARLNTGITADIFFNDFENFYLLKMPMGIDLLFGKKVQAVVGTGIQPGVLLSHLLPGYSRNIENRKIVFDAFAHIGIRYSINEHYAFFAKFQVEYFPSVIYRQNYYHAVYTSVISRYDDHRMFSNSYNIGFSYNIPTKQKK